MKYIQLTRGYQVLVDDDDYEYLSKKKYFRWHPKSKLLSKEAEQWLKR